MVARLGWELDERTRARFQNAKEEKAIEALSPYHRGYELEEIGHEEDGLRVLAAMEAEGWMHHLFPAWTMASADTTALEEMRKLVTQLQMQGVSPDISAASMDFLTAKLSPKDLRPSRPCLFARASSRSGTTSTMQPRSSTSNSPARMQPPHRPPGNCLCRPTRKRFCGWD